MTKQSRRLCQKLVSVNGKSTNGSDLSLEPETEQEKTATAILRKKNKPNSLVVDDATNDDNSVVTMSNNTMETLNIFRGDNVILKGKKRKDTVLVALVSVLFSLTYGRTY